jgi:hypothetical protein
VASAGYIAKAAARVLTGLITVGKGLPIILPSDDASESFSNPRRPSLTFRRGTGGKRHRPYAVQSLTGTFVNAFGKELFSSIRIREERATPNQLRHPSQKPVWGWT